LEEIMVQVGARRWWALGALVLTMLVIGFDSTILNVALPTLTSELGATNSQLQWIVDAYTVVFAAAMLPAGLLGDRFGRKRMLIIGLVLFAGASLAGTLVQSANALIALRAVMGAGGAILMPLSMAVLPSIFPPHERARAVSAWAASSMLAMPLGPIIGGWLLQHFWWGSIFFINVPTTALALVAVIFLLPESRDPAARRLDLIGAALGVVGLTAFIFGVIEAPSWGWGEARVLTALIGGVALLAALVWWERHTREPMIDLSLFRDRNFSLGTVAGTFVSFALFGAMFVLPQYFQDVLGSDPIGTGLKLLPMIGGMFAAVMVANRLVPRLGARTVIAGGLLLLAAGLLLGAGTSVADGYGFTAIWLVVAGVGTGFSLVPAMSVVVATLPPARAGVGSSVVTTLRQTAAALGVAALGSMLASAYTHRVTAGSLPAGLAHAARESVGGGVAVATRLHDTPLLASVLGGYVHGMDLVLLVCGIAALPGALLVALFLPGRAKAAASDETPVTAREPMVG
jgi:EmrB/QacA subfamily drug resistance transporter